MYALYCWSADATSRPVGVMLNKGEAAGGGATANSDGSEDPDVRWSFTLE